MSKILLVAVAFILVADRAAFAQQAREQATRPNIIYILADDLGYGDLGCYGQQHFETPNIDRLASQGMRFTQHYSGSTVCAPSRSTIFTGLHTGHTPIRGNTEVQPEGQVALPASTNTLSEHLQSHNYSTGLFGKWGLGSPGSEGDPINQGFSRFYGYNCQRLAHHYYPYFLWNNRQRDVLWNNFGTEQVDYAPDLIQQQTIRFIESNQQQPFFLFYAHVIPHAEMAVDEQRLSQFRGKFGQEKPYEGLDGGPGFRRSKYGSQLEPKAAFAAMVTLLDEHVGEIVAKVEELGIADNTLIVFSSDNGPHEEGGHDPDFFNSAGGLRGVKRDLYEGGIRVPMIASWPGAIEPKSSSGHISAQWDLFPTFADVAKIEAPGNLDGISFLPTLLGKTTQPEHEYLYWEFHEKKGRQAIRQGNWKAVRYDVSLRPNAKPELYDLSVDPAESTNVASEQPRVLARMIELMSSARTTNDNPKFNFPKGNRRRKAG